MGKGKSKGPLSFCSSSIRCRPKKATADPPSPSLLSQQQPIGAVGSSLGGGDGAVTKAKKKTGLARLWMRFNRSGQSELVELDRNSIIARCDSGERFENFGPLQYSSGMLVQDPSKGNDVDEIFNQARQLGAVERPLDQLLEPQRATSFTGTGRLLSGEPVQSASQPPQATIHNIVFWTNGFTVNDGPLRRLDDPENASFLESIKRSECPKELEPADKRSSVNVNLIRRNEKCPEPEKTQVPFQGVGRTLGSSSTTATSESTTTSRASSTTPTPPSAALVVDQSLPSTSIQIRLADGTRLISSFNYHHTIRDIRAFIDSSRPEGATNYQLQMMGFPPKILTDEDQSIESAGLANSVVIQKF